jgi:hypothetical protein
MTEKSPASKPNPALTPLQSLIGEWKTTGKHPYMPDADLHGRATFEWLEGGAFVIMHAAVDHPQFPAGIAIIGSDDGTDEFFMLYFDERGVSRKYDFTIKGNEWKWWRDAPDFKQRFTVTVSDDGRKMIGKGEMSRDGGEWEGDLSLVYERE